MLLSAVSDYLLEPLWQLAVFFQTVSYRQLLRGAVGRHTGSTLTAGSPGGAGVPPRIGHGPFSTGTRGLGPRRGAPRGCRWRGMEAIRGALLGTARVVGRGHEGTQSRHQPHSFGGEPPASAITDPAQRAINRKRGCVSWCAEPAYCFTVSIL